MALWCSYDQYGFREQPMHTSVIAALYLPAFLAVG